MCYLIAKDRNAHGCFALKTTQGHFVDTEQEFISLVKGLRP